MTVKTLALCLTLVLAATLAAAQSAPEYTARMAQEHQHDMPTATPAAETPPAAAITTRDVQYAHVGDQAVTGYLAAPATGTKGAPGVLVIHEWWGLNDNVKAMARRLAGEGYVALAVDLYLGQVAADPQQARELMMASQGQEEKLDDSLRQAYRYLKDELGVGRVGSIGWCFGGGWSLRAALILPEPLDATVIYYGRLVTDEAQLAPLKTPILGLFGSEDRGIPVAAVEEFEATLKRLGKPAEIHVYPGADHAFANPSGQRYNAAAAEDAWGKTLAFFAAHLKG